MNTKETTNLAVSENTATPEQLAEWKNQYGEFFGILIGPFLKLLFEVCADCFKRNKT